MAEKIYRDLADAIRRVIEYEPERRRAKLGYVYKGEYTIVDPDDQRFYFARFSDGGFVRARHYGKISPVADADVIVVKEKGGHRLEPVLNQWESGENTNVGSSVGYHTHKRGDIFAYEIDLWLLQNMRPTLDNGMILSVADGFYRHAGELKYFYGDTIDLTSSIPATSGYHGWVVVGLDPATDTLTAYAGTPTFSFADLNQADIANIDIGDDLPIAALDLNNGDTEIDESGIVDLRLVPLRAAPLISTTSSTITLSSDAATLNHHYSFFLIAAQTGTSDDLSTLTVTGTPRLIMLQADTGDTITVKHNVGNIKLASGLDYVLSGDKTLSLFWDGTNLADISPAYPISPLTSNLDFDGYNATDINTLNLDDSTELTIASGAVTATQSWHRIDTEADAADDNLDTINGGADGSLLYLRAENTARTVVLRHGIGNIRTFDEQDITLDTNAKCAALMYDGTLGYWLAISIYNAGSGGSGGGSFSGDAFYIDYTPTDATDWSSAPDNVGSALDTLAADVSAKKLTHAYHGYDGIGASSEIMTGAKAYMKKITLTEDAWLGSIGVYIDLTATTNVQSLAAWVLTDNAGTPNLMRALGQRWGNPEFFMTTTARWVEIGVGVWLTAGDYWLVVQRPVDSGTDLRIFYDASVGSDKTQAIGGAWSADGSQYAITSTTNRYSIRASILT